MKHPSFRRSLAHYIIYFYMYIHKLGTVLFEKRTGHHSIPDRVGLLFCGLVVILPGFFFAHYAHAIPPFEQCQLDAQICPDGSSVYRQAPSCEFAECPPGPGIEVDGGTDLTTLTLPGTVSTNGASLSDPGEVGPIVSWEYVSGPVLPEGTPDPVATPIGGGDPGATFSGLTTAGTYTFRMFTCCYPGDVEDFVTVTVAEGVPPTADAGNDVRVISAGMTPIEGYSASSQYATGADTDGSVQSVTWTFISGPEGEVPTITPQVDDPYGADFSAMYSGGSYTFRMTVEDSDGLQAYDDMIVDVCLTNLGPGKKGGDPDGGCFSASDGDLASGMTPTVNGTLAQGQSVTFNGRVQNTGDTDISDAYWTKFRYKWGNQSWVQLGDQILKDDILPMSSGASDDDTSDSFVLQYQTSLTIAYCVDSLSDITESDESNNCMTETFEVGPALPPCEATTISHCELEETAVGDSDGQCALGYSGVCSYTCSSDGDDSSWSANSNSCSNGPTGDIVADSESIIAGQTVTLTWTSTNTGSCTVSPTGWTGTNESGGRTDTPFVTTIYALTCDGILVDAVTVDVNSTGMQPVLSSLGGQYVARGSTVTISWDTNNFALGGESLCTLTGGGITGSELQNGTGDDETGTADVTVDARTSFTLTCPTGVSEYIIEVIPEGIEI